MAIPLIHEIQYPGMSVPAYQRKISYGKCLEYPNTQNQLWFVTIFRGDGKPGPKEFAEPVNDLTFLVPSEFARPVIFDNWKRNIEQWTNVAHKIFQGYWCPRYEVLYTDLPVYEHTMEDGSIVKYAYCKSVDDIDLWYIAFKDGDVHLVKQEFANPSFIDRVGTDQLKWMKIGLGGNFASYGLYDLIAPGKLSPYLVDRLEPGDLSKDTLEKLSAYEDVVQKFHKKNKDGDWNSLDRSDKEYWLRYFQKYNK